MKWLKSFPDGRGGFDSIEWDMGDVGMEYVINIFKYIFFGFLLCMFIPPLLLGCHSGECKERRKIQTYVSVACGTLFLLDAICGGIFWTILVQNGEPGPIYTWIVTLNCACIIAHITLQLLDSKFERIYNKEGLVSIFNGILWFVIIFGWIPDLSEWVGTLISHEPMGILSETYYKS